MRIDLKYPTLEATKSVLTKVGINPDTRIGQFDQDYQYTSCKLQELEKYFSLYQLSDTTDQEKRVLGCYFLECLNEHVGASEKAHFLQNRIFQLLHQDIYIHKTELEYWGNTEDPDEET